MYTKSNETQKNEKLFAAIVLASAIFSAAIILLDEITTTIDNPIGMISWLRVPFGLYLGLFPVGYLALAFLFSFEEMPSLERFGLSIAASISINVVSILLANIFLGFPITLERNVLIILFWSFAFYFLFLFRASFVPVAMEFWQKYDWEFDERENRFAWLKLIDLVLFVSILCGLIIAVASITRAGQPFNGITVALAPIAALFILLFPCGYFVLYSFFERKERSTLANSLLSIALSIPVHIASAIILFVAATIFPKIIFSFAKILLVSVALVFLLYLFVFFNERIIPIIYYWLDRRQREWQ